MLMLPIYAGGWTLTRVVVASLAKIASSTTLRDLGDFLLDDFHLGERIRVCT